MNKKGGWVKGQSGNPSGKPRNETYQNITTLARAACPEAIAFHIKTLRDEGETWERREKSANAILDRGIGKPVQAVVTEDEDGHKPVGMIIWQPPT